MAFIKDKIHPLDRASASWGGMEFFLVRLEELPEDEQHGLKYRWMLRLIGRGGIADVLCETENLHRLSTLDMPLPYTDGNAIRMMALAMAEAIESTLETRFFVEGNLNGN